MNGFYDLLLFLFIFGIAAGVVNEAGFGTTQVPSPGITISEDAVTGVQEGAANQTSSDFSVWEVILSFMRVIGSGVAAMFLAGLVFGGMLASLGMDSALATMIGAAIQAPITFVTLFGLYEWWTGRSVT